MALGIRKHPYIDPLGHKEVRLVVGVQTDGTVVPYGAWTNESWRDIGAVIKQANHSSPKYILNLLRMFWSVMERKGL